MKRKCLEIWLLIIIGLSACKGNSFWQLPTDMEPPSMTISAETGETETRPMNTQLPSTAKTLTPMATISTTIIPINTEPSYDTLNTLDYQKDYIIYVDSEPGTNNEIWAINPDDNEPLLIIKGAGIWPDGWSPSGKHWLFSDNYALFLANADGSDFHQILRVENYRYLYPFWLSDTTLLINAFTDLPGMPDVLIFDIERGSYEVLERGNMIIQAVLPDQDRWIQVKWDTRMIELADRGGSTVNIPKEYCVDSDIYAPTIQIIPTKDEMVYRGCFKLWLAPIDLQSEPIEIFDPGEEGSVDAFRVSPDYQSVAFTYTKVVEGKPIIYLNIVNLDTLELEHQWIYPYWLNSYVFEWSPDSQFIVLPYVSSGPGTSPEVHRGIQIMDVETGALRIVLEKNVVSIEDWILLK